MQEREKDKKKEIVLFSVGRQELNREVKKHKALVMQMEQDGIDPNVYNAFLGAVAAYTGLILDGVYTPRELENLEGILIQRLRKKGVIVVV